MYLRLIEVDLPRICKPCSRSSVEYGFFGSLRSKSSSWVVFNYFYVHFQDETRHIIVFFSILDSLILIKASVGRQTCDLRLFHLYHIMAVHPQYSGQTF